MKKIYIEYFKEEPCKDCNAIKNCKSLGIECALREHYIDDAIPKKEAIRRIARVYGCGNKAEAALNALLGVKKW